MSRRDPLVSLRQKRDHAHEVVELVRGRSRSDLDDDIDHDIVWQIVTTDLPLLASTLIFIFFADRVSLRLAQSVPLSILLLSTADITARAPRSLPARSCRSE